MPPQEQPPTDKRAASQALFRLRTVKLSAELLFLMAWMILTEQLWSQHVRFLSQTEQGMAQVASLAGAGVAYLLMFGLLAVRKGTLTARLTGLAPKAKIAKAISVEALRLAWALGVVLVWMPLAWARVIPIVLLGAFLIAMYSGIGQRTRKLISGPPAPDDIRDRMLTLERLAGQMGIGDVPIKVIDPFPYPAMLAACAAVGKRQDCILLSRMSLALLDDREMMAVLAHEVAHSRLGHTRSHPGRFVAIYGALIAIAVVLSAARGAAVWSYLPGPPGLLLVLSLVGLLLHPVTAALDRRTEQHANRLALELTADPAAFISGLAKLARHLGADRPLRWWEQMICSAPSLEQSAAQARRFAHEHSIALEESPQEAAGG